MKQSPLFGILNVRKNSGIPYSNRIERTVHNEKNISEKWSADLYEVLLMGIVEAYPTGGYIIEPPHELVPPAPGFDITWIEVNDSESPSVTVRGMLPEDADDDTVYIFSNQFTPEEIYDIKQHVTYYA